MILSRSMYLMFQNGEINVSIGLISQIRTPYNLILILLATAEFLLTTVGITADVFSLVGWGLDRIGCIVTGTVVTTAGIPTYVPINPLLLNIHYYFRSDENGTHQLHFYRLGFASMITLCVLSICRLSSFLHFRRIEGKISSFSTALKISSAILLYSLSLALPPLFGWGRYTPEVSGLG